MFHDHHQPTQREAEGDPQAPDAPARARAGRAVRRRGRGSAGGGGRRGLARGRALLRGRERPRRRRGRGRRCWPRPRGSASGTRALAVYDERWAPAPAGPAVRVPARRPRSRQRRRGAALGAGVRRLVAWRSAPGSADPFGPKAVRASMGAVFAVPLARVDDDRRAPGIEDRASSPGRAGRCADARDRRRGEVTLLIGSEREGLPRSVVRAGRPRRPHPDPHRLAQRRDGRHGRALRAD